MLNNIAKIFTNSYFYFWGCCGCFYYEKRNKSETNLTKTINTSSIERESRPRRNTDISESFVRVDINIGIPDE